MRKPISLAVAAILMSGLAADAAADRRHHHGHHGNHGGHGYYFAAPLLWGAALRPYPYYYGYGYGGYRPYGYGAYGYDAPTVIVEREPTVYVQRAPVAPVTQAATGPAPLWFYCTDPAGYFPYVKHCSQPWISVDPSTVATAPGQ